jgi:multimeric flavodoxin WrbA
MNKDGSGKLLSGVTEELVKYIVEKTGEPYELLSLSGKRISGCMGCVRCAKDNVCVIDDDWAEIRDKMFAADAVVFGAPNYYGSINSIAHAFLERTFSLRHRERFPLSGKLNAIVAVGSEEANPVEDYIRMMFRSNHMAEPVGVLRASGINQCYLCGYGHDCAAGAVVAKHGFLPSVEDYHFPVLPQDTYKRAFVIAHKLGAMVRAKRPVTV